MTSDPTVEKPQQAETDFAAQMHAFWDKNRSQVLILCAAVFLGIIGREGWNWYRTSHEQDVEEAYARVGDSPDQLAKFAEANSGHELAGVALLRVADAKYASADFAAAQAAYTKATAALGNSDLKSRARLGAVMSQLAAGDQAGAETGLKALLADTTLAKQVRAEAGYDLASLANQAGRVDDVKKYVDEVTKVDATGAWAQRAFVLRARLGADKAPEASSSGLTFKPGK